ncbi:hypothetical protein [Leeuwenhoekiella sp. H156]|uniref:hypothetical protein n=1 Tax=Leeuwenhoekiella sp. H156 TaxID=3450128 RepID=UPI003FA48BE6
MKNLVMTVAAAATLLFATQNINAQEQTGGEMAVAKTQVEAPIQKYTPIEVSELPVTVTDAVKEDKAGATVTEAWADAEKKTFKLTLEKEGAEAETAYINAAGEWIEPKE